MKLIDVLVSTRANIFHNLFESFGYRHFQKESGHRFAFQITTDDPKWGGLSGCTFEEVKSWGKIEKESAHCAVYMDATVRINSHPDSAIPAFAEAPARRTRLRQAGLRAGRRIPKSAFNKRGG
ncbi:MAG: deoxyhypusine synthase family protein [Thermodesulfobacteriota bacterium]|nr:deoxyhypusine synthase family protein [Thermodesulfobacteriota bacterium]